MGATGSIPRYEANHVINNLVSSYLLDVLDQSGGQTRLKEAINASAQYRVPRPAEPKEGRTDK